MVYNPGELAMDEASHYEEFRTEIRQAFTSLALPVPQAREFIFMRLGYLAALQEYGAVIRAERNDPNGIVMPIDHPLVLQPIGTLTQDKQRFELCPGVPRVAVERQDYDFLVDALEQSGLVCEASLEDTGYLPVTTPDFPGGIPVIIDRTDIRWPDQNLSNIFAVHALSHLPEDIVQAQAVFYGPLCRAFEAFQRENNEDSAQEFWSLMKQAVRDDKLFSNWQWHGYRQSEGAPLNKGGQLSYAANNYSQALRRDALHGSVLSAA